MNRIKMESFGHPWPMYCSNCLALFWYLGPPWGPDGGPDCPNYQNGTNMTSKMVPGTLKIGPKQNITA